MGEVYIKFDTRQAEEDGTEALAVRTRVNFYRGHVYSVPEEELRWLDEAGVPYRRASEVEVEAARAHRPVVHAGN